MAVKGLRVWLSTLAALLVASVAVTGVVVTRFMYARELAVRLDPLGRVFYSESGALPRRAGVRQVVLYGDSRAQQWPTPEVSGFRFTNRGIGGQTSAQILERSARDLFALQPDVVVLELCTNDLKAVSMLPGRAEEVIAGCVRHTAELVRRARERGIEVVLCSVFALGGVPAYRRLFDLTPDMEAAIARVNRELRVRLRGQVSWLDADAALNEPGGRLRAGFSEDGVHLTRAGYAALDPALRALLEGLPKKDGAP